MEIEWSLEDVGRYGWTYEELLHARNDLTSPNESHILPASAILIATCGLRIIRIEPFSSAPPTAGSVDSWRLT
jgi:hypothetical protein